jgi:hypothetical protein
MALLTSLLLVLFWVPGLVGASPASAASTFNAEDYAQCANGAPPSTALDCPDSWINGILQGSNSHYAENQVTPQRLQISFDTDGTHTLDLKYLDRTGGVHAYDSLATWNYTQTAAERCQDLPTGTPCIPDADLGADTHAAIPVDNTVVPPADPSTTLNKTVSSHALSGQHFVMYGGTITAVSAITHDANVDNPSKDDYAHLTITFTIPAGNTNNNTVQLLFGGHIAAGLGPNGWGANLGASAIPGGNYHIKWDLADGVSVGNRDNQLQAGAILPAQNTSIVTSATAGPVTVSSSTYSISDSATMTPANAAGSVIFKAYGPVAPGATPPPAADCSTVAFTSSALPVNTTTGVAGPATYNNPAPGYYFWRAFYTPTDATKFTPVDGTCGATGETSLVQKASPNITTQASPATGTVGVTDTFGDTATFSSAAVAPTGSVTFTLYSNNTCTTAVSGMTGSGAITGSGPYTATFSKSWTPPAAATYYWQASYAGDANNNPKTTGCTDANEQILVGAASPGITTQASPTTGTAGVTNTFGDTATFGSAAVAPTGSVTFTLYSNNTCTTAVSGMSGSGAITGSGPYTASFSKSWTPPATGTYYWQASYAGDSNNNQFTTGCTDANEQIVVSPASPNITTQASPATGTAGVTDTFSDTATFSSAAVSPTGSVSFTLYADSSCTSPVSGMSGSGPITGSGPYTATFSKSWTPLVAGTYYWQASYAGDDNNNAKTTGCTDAHEQIVVSPASPNITTQASPTLGTAGVTDTFGDTATFSAAAVSPTGSVTFTLYSDNTCATAVAGMSGTGAITGSGPYTASFSKSWTPPAAGTYYWQASYAGDNNNNAKTTGCTDSNEQIIVGKASPNITTQASPTTATAGVSGTFGDTATFSAAAVSPTGSVSFALYSDPACSMPVASMSGSGAITGSGPYTASFSKTWTPPATGTYYWQASYAGDVNNNPKTTGCTDSNEQITVSPASPGITTQASPTTGTAGVSGTFGDTATFSAAAVSPTGSVTFTLYSDNTCATAVSGMSGTGAITGSGPYTATFSKSWTPPAAGTYYWRASYAGDSNNNQFTTGCTDSNEQIAVGKASPNITTQADPTVGTAGVTNTFGDTATFSAAAVSPTGSVTFTLYSDNTCSTAVSGMSGSGLITGSGPYTASFSKSWTPPATGTYYWQASYAGDSNNNPKTTGCTDSNEQIVVSPASPNITTQASPTTGTAGVSGTFGDTATFSSAAVSPTGSVSFTLYADSSCTSPVSGMSGSGAITGSGPYTASFSKSWTPTVAGTYYWQASYAGDSNNNPKTTGCTDSNEQIVVSPASPNITTQASPTTGTAGVTNTFGDTATFSSAAVSPTGSVTFTLYSDNTCTTAVSGMSGSGPITGSGPYTATFSKSWTPPATGTYYWQASYAGDNNNNAKTTGCTDSNEQITVGKASPNITTQASPTTGTAGVTDTFGDTATFSAAAVSPTGSVTFTLYSDNTCSTAVSGMSGTGAITGSGPYTASFSKSWTPLAAGTYYWQASYAGDVNNNPKTTGCADSNEQITVGKASPSITTQADPTVGTAGVANTFGDTATFSAAAVSPTGSVSFALYSDPACSMPVAGMSGSGAITGSGPYTASFSKSWTPPATGTYYWQASYAGDSNNNPKTTGCTDSNEQITVSPASPGLTTQASPTLGTAGVTNTFGDTAIFGAGAVSPTGSVTFTLYSDNTCTTAVAGMSGSGPITGSGPYSATFSKSWTPPATGTYYWQASYAGDSNNNPKTTGCTDSNEQITVSPASPNITTQASPTTGTAGVTDTFGDTATFSSAAVSPTGSVSFTLYSDNTCATAVSGMSGTGAITGSGPYTATFSKSWTPPAAGTYYWQASYAGDSNNNPKTTGCTDSNEQITVGKASPSITTVASPQDGTATIGGTFGDTATFSAAAVSPTGSVSFTLYSDSACSMPVASMSGSGAITGSGPYTASFSKSWAPPAAGTYYWQASYVGDANNNAFTSGCTDENEQITVVPHRDSLSITKAITANGDSLPVAGFVFNVSCTDGTSATLTFHSAGTQSVSGIVDGSVCDVTETPVAGWTSSPSGTQHVTVGLGGASVSFTNTRDTGIITVTKATSGAVAGASTVFVFDVVCPNAAFNQKLTIDTSSANSATSSAIPTGMVCTVVEEGTSGWQQTTPAQGGVDVTVPGTAAFTNTRLTGPLQLIKSVTPATGSYTVGDPSNTLNYTLSLSPTGALDHTGVTVTDYIPGYDPSDSKSGKTTYVAGSAGCSTGCAASYDAAHHLLTWTVGNVAHNAAAILLTFKVTIDRPAFNTTVGLPAENIDNIGFVQSVQQSKTPSNQVKTPVTAVLGVKVVRPPVLAFTGLPAQVLLTMGLLMLGAGIILASVRRKEQ